MAVCRVSFVTAGGRAEVGSPSAAPSSWPGPEGSSTATQLQIEVPPADQYCACFSLLSDDRPFVDRGLQAPCHVTRSEEEGLW